MSGTFFSAAASIFAGLLLALITWGPTILVFRRKRERGEAVRPRHLALALIGELMGVTTIAVLADTFGLHDIAGYLLAIALLVGAAGAQAFSSMRFNSGG